MAGEAHLSEDAVMEGQHGDPASSSTVQQGGSSSSAPPQADGPRRKRRRLIPAGGTGETSEPEHLHSFEEFRATLAYFFTLFRRNFSASLEEAAREQWARLQADDVQVHEDGQNNPLVEMRIESSFAKALADALADESGKLPILSVPHTAEQLSCWRTRARRAFRRATLDRAAALSEAASHLETMREVVDWHLASGGRTSSGPLRIVLLGASARYEYVAHHGSPVVDWSDAKGVARQLAEALAAVLDATLSSRAIEVLLCGRDVPSELDGHEDQVSGGRMLVRHQCQYLHDIVEARRDSFALTGCLCIAFHGGLGLDHPELSITWPPTLRMLADAAPTWLAVTSFNTIEHEAAERMLRSEWPTGVHIDRSGVNPCGSLAGQAEIGPFDGSQGKRNYCLLCARFSAPVPAEAEALFD